uniref:GH16 domain-containing protein n=1 Tax=Lactuca sativa TaxID=4236 RepID=A0A9R1UT40_LACSA|nr:hypothetical protein LSAT_V11C800447730 [Lactuca sativa]
MAGSQILVITVLVFEIAFHSIMAHHSSILGNGDDLQLFWTKLQFQLSLIGPGIQSKRAFLFGSIEMLIKLVPGNSAETVTSYYPRLKQ